MYLDYYGLSTFPFGLTPNTSFFCDLPTHREALNVLLVALHSGEGFVKITGEVGTGKTLLCRKLLKELDNEFITAYIPNPCLTPKGLLRAVAQELGIDCRSHLDMSVLFRQINKRLIDIATRGKRLVLVIDEAQTMSIKSLEILRLLTNLETESCKLLQIVLFGQPELNAILGQPIIRQLRQRITFSYHLLPLDRAGVRSYVWYRLKVAGWSKWLLFNRLAYISLWWYSRGIPRLVNILAHKALMSAYGQGREKVGLRHVRRAAKDTEDAKGLFRRSQFRKPIAMALSLAVVLLVIDHLRY